MRTILFIINSIILGAAVLFAMGIPLLWVVPGIAIGSSRGRRLSNTVGWLAWFGPFGLLPIAFGERQLERR